MATRMCWIALSLLASRGAKPPSSPTAVVSLSFLSDALSAWKTSAPARSASAKVGAAQGTIMNSWISRPLSACTPPFRMFIVGVGRTRARRRRGSARAAGRRVAAAARATAIETARMALAPSLALVGGAVRVDEHLVDGGLVERRSCPRWRAPSLVSTLWTAFCTPLPPKRALSPSRSSTASCSPVDAPLGTAALPTAVSVATSTSTVGLPRESRISSARTLWILGHLETLLVRRGAGSIGARPPRVDHPLARALPRRPRFA